MSLPGHITFDDREWPVSTGHTITVYTVAVHQRPLSLSARKFKCKVPCKFLQDNASKYTRNSYLRANMLYTSSDCLSETGPWRGGDGKLVAERWTKLEFVWRGVNNYSSFSSCKIVAGAGGGGVSPLLYTIDNQADFNEVHTQVSWPKHPFLMSFYSVSLGAYLKRFFVVTCISRYLPWWDLIQPTH